MTPPVAVMTTTITTCGWSSDHLDVADLGRLERRRRDEGDERRDLRQHLGGDPKGGVDLAPDVREVDREHGRRERLLEERLGVEPVAGVGRHPARRRVRMVEEAERLELGELVAHGRRRCIDRSQLDERLRPDRMAARDVGVDHVRQDHDLARRQRQARAHRSTLATTSLARNRPRSVRAIEPSRRSSMPAAASRVARAVVDERGEPVQLERRVEPQAEHQPLGAALGGRQQLDLGGRVAAGLDGRQVAAQAGAVAAPLEADRRDRADAHAEVVVPEPVAQVVAALVARPAEVGRLVPAVARRRAAWPRPPRSRPPSPRPAARARGRGGA